MINQPILMSGRPEPGASASAMCGCRWTPRVHSFIAPRLLWAKLLLLLVGLVLLELTVAIKVGSVIEPCRPLACWC